MKKLKGHAHFLQMLARSSLPQRRAILHTANRSQIRCLCEICLNVLAGNVPINIKKLKKHKNAIRKLANKSIKFQTKKRMLINQAGGFLPLILPAILSGLSGIIGRAIGNRL